MVRKMLNVDETKVKMILQNNNLTPKQFVEEFGHTMSWYKHITTYDKRISLADAKAIKAVYGVDVELKPTIKEPIPTGIDTGSYEHFNSILNNLNNSITQLDKNCLDYNTDILERLDRLETTTSEMAVTLRTIGNLLTQINEKCYMRDKK